MPLSAERPAPERIKTNGLESLMIKRPKSMFIFVPNCFNNCWNMLIPLRFSFKEGIGIRVPAVPSKRIQSLCSVISLCDLCADCVGRPGTAETSDLYI